MPQSSEVADLAPTGDTLTEYDEQHLVLYLRLLDAEREGAAWRAVARIVLNCDPDRGTVPSSPDLGKSFEAG